MNKILFVIMFFLLSCSNNTLRKDFIFSDDISFEEFKIKLIEYANNNPYPNIDD